jgi:hypothetical protein
LLHPNWKQNSVTRQWSGAFTRSTMEQSMDFELGQLQWKAYIEDSVGEICSAMPLCSPNMVSPQHHFALTTPDSPKKHISES